jgi:DNA repair exonuclease SbcCD nuclease subunit
MQLVKKVRMMPGENRITMRFRFLHCADVHLGRQRLSGGARYRDYFTAFSAVVDHARIVGAEAVLIAGDFFEEQEPAADTIIAACDALRPLRTVGIPVFAIEGNHDRRKRGEERCALDILAAEGYLHLLRPDIDEKNLILRPYVPGAGGAMVGVTRDVCIAGLGFIGHAPEERHAQAAAQLPADACTILLSHTLVSTADEIPYGCCSAEDLAPLGDRVAYLATGHRHTRALGTPLPFVFNPGALEFVYPHDYRQSADLRGFLDVTITDGEVAEEERAEHGGDHTVEVLHRFGRWNFRVRHIPTDKRPAVVLRVDISACPSPERVSDAVRAVAVDAIDETLRARGVIAVLRLQGRFAMARSLLPVESLRAMLCDEYGAVHAEVTDRDLVGATGDALLVHDGGDTAEMAQRARDIAATLLRAAGLAVGRENACATALIEAKEDFGGRARTPGSDQLDALADRLRPFVDGGGDE